MKATDVFGEDMDPQALEDCDRVAAVEQATGVVVDCPHCEEPLELEAGEFEESNEGIMWPTMGGYRTCLVCDRPFRVGGFCVAPIDWPGTKA